MISTFGSGSMNLALFNDSKPFFFVKFCSLHSQFQQWRRRPHLQPSVCSRPGSRRGWESGRCRKISGSRTGGWSCRCIWHGSWNLLFLKRIIKKEGNEFWCYEQEGCGRYGLEWKGEIRPWFPVAWQKATFAFWHRWACQHCQSCVLTFNPLPSMTLLAF